MKIQTNIVFEKYDANHDLLERRIQTCKSFIKQLWELMYIQAAQINYATPRSGVIDAAGVSRTINQIAQIPAGVRPNDLSVRATLMLQAPGGNGLMYVPGGGMVADASQSIGSLSHIGYMLRGEALGICIGSGNTPVAPNDYQLADRLFHGQRAAEGVSIIMQSNLAADTSGQTATATAHIGCVFTAQRGFALSSVKLKLYRTGTPGILTLGLRGTSSANMDAGENQVPGPELTSIATATTDGDTLTNVSPGEWREFTFATPVQLIPGTIYVLVLSAAASSVTWRSSGTHNKNSARVTSADTGVTWSTQDVSPVYELWGTSNAEVEYGGCEIRGLAVANPNASFIISRNFYNGSGGAISIEECGLAGAGFTNKIAGGTNLLSWRSDAYPFLIARDVIAPAINLLDTEVLQVSYTPAVTV